ncbi:MAG: rhodanese-like domain-containing protein [Pseudonocardiaceae bacterium]
MATPGHTDEHLSFVLFDGSTPLGVFTGGSLIVGSAARTDLLGPERAEELAWAQYRSLRRLATLPEPTAVWPTHGAGSFCAAPPGAQRLSTIGREIATNPLLQAADGDAFVRALLGSLGSYPPYFLRLAEINRRGPAILDVPGTGWLAPLTVSQVRGLRADGALVIDARPVTEYTTAHIPAALSVPLRAQFATWLGWLAPPNTPLVIVRAGDQDVEEIGWQALKIGYDQLVGELAGGMDAWIAVGQPARSTELVTPDQIGDRCVLDVRQLPEFTSGHLPGARHVERAASAASLLEHAGYRDVAVLTGGPGDWARVTGRDLETGA